MAESQDLAPLRKAMDDFSLNLYHQVAQGPAGKSNIFLSPLSISSALFLAYAGAKAQTRSEIAAALTLDKHFSGKDDQVLQAYQSVMEVLTPAKDQSGKNLFELALANKAYLTRGFQIKPEYSAAITKYLHSEIKEVAFKEETEKARQEINAWVEQQTNSKIKDLLQPGSVDASTIMVLVNAIYFKASWLTQFKAELTSYEDFHGLNGQVSKAQLMMIKGKKFEYLEDDGSIFHLTAFQMVEIPYKGREMSMVVVLPREKEGLLELEKKVTGDVLGKILEGSSERKVDLWLPRFKLEETYGLVEVLRSLGIKQLFGNADLSGIAEGGLTCSDAIHKAFVEVNEEGTEAAAATAMMMTRMAMPIAEPVVEFRADRPFLFAIRHNSTGLITFLGRLANV